MEIPSTSQRLSESENDDETVEDDQQRALTLSQIDFPGTVLPDFELLKALSEVLTPFDTFTKQLSQRNESISTVLPIFKCLLSALAEKEFDTSEIKSLKKVIAYGLKTRMEKHENKRFLVIATLIDPRYKNHQNIFSYEDRIQNKVLLQMEIELFINPQRRVSDSEETLNYELLPTQSDNPLSNFLFPTACGSVDSTQSQNDLSNVIINEIDSFFKSPTIEFDADPLVFWRGNSTYPNIKQIVSKYLAPPPGTVESERTFTDFAIDWAHNNGLILRTKKFLDKSDVAEFAPVSLQPSPFPRHAFNKAVAVHKALQVLYFRVACDYEFMMDAYKDVDAHEKGIKQPNTLLIMRADYMVNTLNSKGDDNENELKQIEVNTGAIGGLGIDRRTTELHRQMLQKVGMDTSNLPANNGDTNLIKSLFMAW
uniref:Glutathione synthetase n=1 Tax=Globodera rostochiensis TaxID=31243 RepID=A0A914I548_GLORO